MTGSSKIKVNEAAAKMGVTPQFLRMGLRAGRFPFGTAVLMDKRWSYYINADRFRKYMEGVDLNSDTAYSQGSAEGGVLPWQGTTSQR